MRAPLSGRGERGIIRSRNIVNISENFFLAMAGLDVAIHVLLAESPEDVDARDTRGH